MRIRRRPETSRLTLPRPYESSGAPHPCSGSCGSGWMLGAPHPCSGSCGSGGCWVPTSLQWELWVRVDVGCSTSLQSGMWVRVDVGCPTSLQSGMWVRVDIGCPTSPAVGDVGPGGYWVPHIPAVGDVGPVDLGAPHPCSGDVGGLGAPHPCSRGCGSGWILGAPHPCSRGCGSGWILGAPHPCSRGCGSGWILGAPHPCSRGCGVRATRDRTCISALSQFARSPGVQRAQLQLCDQCCRTCPHYAAPNGRAPRTPHPVLRQQHDGESHGLQPVDQAPRKKGLQARAMHARMFRNAGLAAANPWSCQTRAVILTGAPPQIPPAQKEPDRREVEEPPEAHGWSSPHALRRRGIGRTAADKISPGTLIENDPAPEIFRKADPPSTVPRFHSPQET